jgi:cytochrome c-type biogenesis protein CcmH
MAMTPEMTLSKFPRVVVGARVSRSGSATPQPGDLEGVSAPVASTATGVTVTIANETR